ncbi:hypothetical protein [Paenibacillus sp. NRS-1760]|uniref:hypothetical protein n=1 Tax=Paenibacillus sp. NRS-1760 TaxID=3233902 RepID=UPI003D2E115D
MKRFIEKVEKSSLMSIVSLLLIVSWFFGVTIICLILKTFPGDKTVVAGIIGATGSIIGGLFTLVGVNWTIKKQEANKFWDNYPSRLSNLFIINKLIWDIHREFNDLVGLKNDDYEGRRLHENALIEQLENIYIRASKVDAETFEKINLLEKEVRETLFKLSDAKRNEREYEAFEVVFSIKEKLQECSMFIYNHKNTLSQLFTSKFKNTDSKAP